MKMSVEKSRIVLIIVSFSVSDRKNKLAKQIKKEIIKVRRQLAIQKGQALAESDAEDGKNDTGILIWISGSFLKFQKL